MTSLDGPRQALDDFLAAVRARKKTQALAHTTEAFRERGRDGGDGAARLFDVAGGCRATRGRCVAIGEKVAAEIWRTTTEYWPGGSEPSRRPMLVHLVQEEGCWRIDDAELNKRLRGRAQMRQAEDPGAPVLPAALSDWLAALAREAGAPKPSQPPSPVEQLRALSSVGELRPTMVKKASGSRGLCVQFLMEGPGFGRRSFLHWGEFARTGKTWEMTSWRRRLAPG